jgi:hypothetical protein
MADIEQKEASLGFRDAHDEQDPCIECIVEKTPTAEEKSALMGFWEHSVSYGLRLAAVEEKPCLLPT